MTALNRHVLDEDCPGLLPPKARCPDIDKTEKEDQTRIMAAKFFSARRKIWLERNVRTNCHRNRTLRNVLIGRIR